MTFRWTVGDVHPLGFEILKLSVQQIQKLYPEAELVIAYNNIDPSLLPKVDRLVNQHEHKEVLYRQPNQKETATAWKLYPPRTNINSAEISIDNDLVLHRRPPQIDEFLKGSRFLISEAFERAYGQQFESVAPLENYNTGIVGYPAGYNPINDINSVLQSEGDWSSHFDEQAVVSSLMKKPLILSLDDIAVCKYQTPYKLGRYGMHFIGANKGYDVHWLKYKNIM